MTDPGLHMPPLSLGRGAGGEGMITKPLPRPSRALLARARHLRRDATDAERFLWRLLRNRQFLGFKFRRQHPLAGYVLDFYCHEARLAIELDGGQHAEPERATLDAKRTQELETLGVRVVRFWNNDVLRNPEGVLEVIWAALED